MKKLKILKLSRDFRYLQKVALKNILRDEYSFSLLRLLHEERLLRPYALDLDKIAMLHHFLLSNFLLVRIVIPKA